MSYEADAAFVGESAVVLGKINKIFYLDFEPEI